MLVPEPSESANWGAVEEATWSVHTGEVVPIPSPTGVKRASSAEFAGWMRMLPPVVGAALVVPRTVRLAVAAVPPRSAVAFVIVGKTIVPEKVGEAERTMLPVPLIPSAVEQVVKMQSEESVATVAEAFTK